MTREQHQAILAFIEETVGGSQPPMDVEADAIIRALFVRNPDAAYRMTMRAMALAAGLPRMEKLPRKTWLSGFLERRGLPSERRIPDLA